LHYEILLNNEETVKLFLNLGINPNKKDDIALKPLHYAIRTGNSNIMQLLAPLTDHLNQTQIQIALYEFKKKTLKNNRSFAHTVGTHFCDISNFSALFWVYPQYLIHYKVLHLYLFTSVYLFETFDI